MACRENIQNAELDIARYKSIIESAGMEDALSNRYTCKVNHMHGVSLTSTVSGLTSLHWLKLFTSAALSLILRPQQAFCHFQYGKRERAWYLFSHE